MPYQMMHTMARMKTKKYDPYIPMTDRASTGLESVRSGCYAYRASKIDTHKPMWYFAPGRAIRTTTTAARKEPRQADTKDCCHVFKQNQFMRLKVVSKYPWWLTRPTVTRADPVFQPTSEN